VVRASTEPYLEKDIEAQVVKHARSCGIKARKMNGLGYKAWPDHVFFGPGQTTLFIEFKKPGEQPSKLQLKLHQELREMEYDVLVVDNVKKGKEEIDRFFSL